MIEHEEKLTSYSPIKIKLSVISDQVDWEDFPSITGSFSLSVIKNSGEEEKLPDVDGSLLNVIQVINELDVDNYRVANIVQTKTIFD